MIALVIPNLPVSIAKPFIGGLAIRGRRPMRTVALSHGKTSTQKYPSHAVSAS